MHTKLTFFLVFCFFSLFSQPDRWQQHADYTMDIEMNAEKHQYVGKQKLIYTNNSPERLDKVFYHLYFNAFQPGSMMNVRHANMPDGDKRQVNISNLTPEEQGWIKVNSLKQNGKKVNFETNGTILEVQLNKPIEPNTSVTFEMDWDAQVPLQTRRSGRDNKEGIEFSMTQWYPKLCEYDYQGWHANPYIGREFYGVWGDFKVNITIDKDYIVAAGGILQNPKEIGYGYEEEGQQVKRPKGDKLTYKFVAENVHDFAWAADPDYKHVKMKADDGSMMHFFWQPNQGYDEQWEQLPTAMNRARTLINDLCGTYPYDTYAFIQGGDGGMEYPLATLITGNRPINSLIGVSVHEQLHSWYQMILGTNEALYAWMDEGFTSWAEAIVENELAKEGLMPGKEYQDNPFAGSSTMFGKWQLSGQEEPLCIHADHFNTNRAYSIGAYIKGKVFLSQLEYILGKETFRKGMLRYFETWKFKHPNPNDFIRIMEKESGLELDWYLQEYVYTTRQVDYAVEGIQKDGRKTTEVTLTRKGEMAMPLDILVTYKNGDTELFYMPLVRMRGEKAQDEGSFTLLPDHRWTDPEFTFEIKKKKKKITRIEIDPSQRMLDVNREDNVWEK